MIHFTSETSVLTAINVGLNLVALGFAYLHYSRLRYYQNFQIEQIQLAKAHANQAASISQRTDDRILEMPAKVTEAIHQQAATDSGFAMPAPVIHVAAESVTVTQNPPE